VEQFVKEGIREIVTTLDGLRFDRLMRRLAAGRKRAERRKALLVPGMQHLLDRMSVRERENGSQAAGSRTGAVRVSA
jgi:hypothetical protein